MKTFTRYRVLIGAGMLLLALLGLSPAEQRSSVAASPLSIDLPQAAVCQLTPQMAPVPFHIEARAIESGRHTAAELDGTQTAFSTLVQSLDAPWLQIQFGKTDLGHSSYLRLTALRDGAVQELDAATLAAWNNQSAMFNGDTIKIELLAAPEDTAVFFEVKALMVGEWVGGAPLHSRRPRVEQWSTTSGTVDMTQFNPNMVCGTDDRVASTDQAVGRVMPIGCTGWIISNGAFLTAGHCNTGSMTTMHFNVPASNADGTMNAPPPDDQFPINAASIMSANNGVGDDWAVFRVNRNNGTNLTPVQRYGVFYRILPQAEPLTVRVTGYGVDGPAPCFGERRQGGCGIPTPTPVPRNADSQTQQTATAAGFGRSGTIFSHDVDITGGASGGPVRSVDSRLAVAIHTHGTFDAACTTGHNTGTTFTHTALAAAINNFPGASVRYVDEGYPPWTTEDGTVFRPFNLVAEGINTVAAGGIVSIVTGDYNEPMTINKNVILEAPVGTVLIGAP